MDLHYLAISNNTIGLVYIAHLIYNSMPCDFEKELKFPFSHGFGGSMGILTEKKKSNLRAKVTVNKNAIPSEKMI